MSTARKAAAQCQCCSVLDDDGDLVYDKRTQGDPEAFCRLRLQDCLNTPVSSIAWCWGIAQRDLESVRYWQTRMRDISFQPNMPDPTPVVIEFCRQHEIEIFGSIRVNDCHDVYDMPFDDLEYPEFLIGNGNQWGTVESGFRCCYVVGAVFFPRPST